MKSILFCWFILIFLGCNAQSIQELIELHKKNIEGLRRTRSLSPDDWKTTGIVSEEDLIEVVSGYRKNVGLVIYTFNDQQLNTLVYDRSGKIYDHSIEISQDTLIDLVAKANRLFSSLSTSRGPDIRGGEAENLDPTKNELDSYSSAFLRINRILIPNDTLFNGLEHLIIVPALNIATIPFAALKLNDDQYLIDQLSYSIAPSLFEIKVGRKMKENRFDYNSNAQEVRYAFNNALFVGNPSYPADPVWEFPDLPGAEKEVDKITSRLDTNNYHLYKGKQATFGNIMPDICNYDLIYFATHGISDPVEPLDKSFIVLATDTQSSYLTARQIQGIRDSCSLNADLVILSACQTGLGNTHEAGIIGLSRAFQIAGANHVMMTLWNINDDQTSVLMGYFFDALQEGGFLMPHAALRSAILKYKHECNPDPNFWASFSIFGVPY